MEFRFELPEGYSTQDILALNRLGVKKSKIRRWTTPLFRLFLLFLGASFVLSGLSWLDGGYVGATPVWQLVAIPLVFGFPWLFLGLFYFQISTWRSRRLMLKNADSFKFTLNSEGVKEQTNKGTAYYRYDGFVNAYDYQDRWFLFLDKRHAFILPKAALTAGEAGMFAAFWTEKTSKTVIQMKSRRLHR